MIIYIHGFGGSGKGIKASILQKEFKDNSFISPTLSYVPQLAIDTLEQLIKSYEIYNEDIYLIGSSLGGYYSIYLAQKYNLKAVLINPSTNPVDTLSKWTGQALNYGDLSHFEWNDNHIEMLKEFNTNTINPSQYLLLTQTGDEILDYKVAVKKLQGSKHIIVDGGDHSFPDIQNYVSDIKEFFNI